MLKYTVIKTHGGDIAIVSLSNPVCEALTTPANAIGNAANNGLKLQTYIIKVIKKKTYSEILLKSLPSEATTCEHNRT